MQARGWPLHSPVNASERGGTVMLGVADGPRMAEMVARLAARQVFVDCRPGVGLRLSPHFFNTDEEVDAALAVLAEVCGNC